ALDQVVVRALVEHDAMESIAVDRVPADDAVAALLGQDDALLAVVMGDVALDQQAVRAGMRVDAVAHAVMDLAAADHEIRGRVAIEAIEIMPEATVGHLAGCSGRAPGDAV